MPDWYSKLLLFVVTRKGHTDVMPRHLSDCYKPGDVSSGTSSGHFFV